MPSKAPRYLSAGTTEPAPSLHEASLDISTAHSIAPDQFVETIRKQRLASWGMMYCGGSQPVVDALRQIEKRYGIGLSVEKFDW